VTENAQVDTSAQAWEPRHLVGSTLDGRYELTAHLATGGMGAVFRARHVPLRKDVAVKVMRPDLTAAKDLVERFRQEAEIAARLEHENIVRVTDFGRSAEGYLFLVMELLEGESLFERLRREVLLPPEEAVPIFWQVCAALEAAHALNVVHRDLKPENIFLARLADGREIVKLLDFGIAKFLEPTSSSSTAAGMVVGTPEYLSPEQAVGGVVDGRADLYSVGIIAWRALVGRHPFLPNEPRALIMAHALQPLPPITDERPELAQFPDLVAVVARACAKELAERHPNASALKADFATSIGPLFIPPPPPSPTLTPGRPLALTPGRPITVPPMARPSFDLQPPSGLDGGMATSTPAVEHSPTLERQFHVARLRAFARQSLASVRALALDPLGRAWAALGRAWEWLAGRPAVAFLLLALLLGSGAAWLVVSVRHNRVPAEARALLEEKRYAEARELLRAELKHSPQKGELQLLLGHALHGSVGQGACIDAYTAAHALGVLDEEAYANLAADLGLDRAAADRASHLLARIGDPALPAILAATTEGPGVRRLRALALARDLGAEERVDRVGAYVALLKEPDCELRKAAARRLGEIGDAGAVPPLREAAKAYRETKAGIFGRTQRTPACGAVDAAEAAKRIEAVHAAPR
jgi:serine/threonine-protein kinase